MKIIKVKNKTNYYLEESDKKSIRIQMVDLDLTFKLICERTGISRSHLNCVINGKRPFTRNMKRILESIDIRIEEKLL